MTSTAVDGVCIRFTSNGGSEVIDLPQRFQEFKHVKLGYLSYVLNYKNIDTSFGNTRFYLNTAGTVFLNLTPGCYDISDLNTRILLNAISARFYIIKEDQGGLQWSIYSFASSLDRSNWINPTLENPSVNLNSGQNLNKELYSGLFRPDRFKLYSRLLDVHGNVLSSGIS